MSSLQVAQNGMSNAANMSCIYSKKIDEKKKKKVSYLN